ncbi:MAG: O-antigen ligase family protein [bacterium]|nr:O-antigen ligase family protein [bacterium]
MNLSDRLYAAALLLMPFTYGTKFALGLNNLTWVDPTLILGLAVFLLVLPSLEPRLSLFVVLAAFVSGALGFVLLNISGPALSAIYAALREPTRLALNVVFFWVSIDYFRKRPAFVIKWLAISVTIQLGLAIYLWLAAASFVPLFEPAASYSRDYAIRQLVWFGQTPIMRLGGTFMESPPFGLFMFSAFALFSTLIYKDRAHYPWLRIGWGLSLFGLLGSLSDQIYLAFLLFVLIGGASMMRGKSKVVVRVAAVVVLLAISPFLVERISSKVTEANSLKAYNAMGQSGGERIFHARYSLEMLTNNLVRVPFGVGPGRYGAYAARTAVFPTTVTPQVTIVEWIVEHGLIGCCLLLAWIVLIGRRAVRSYGLFGLAAISGLFVANLFQGNWKWEAWFLALAFFFVSGENSDQQNHGGREDSSLHE